MGSLADHNQTTGNTNADGEPLSCGRVQPTDSIDDLEGSANGPFRVIFMRPGVAEIRQYPVTPKIIEETVICGCDTDAFSLKGVEHGAHLFRIEPRRERRR